MCVSIKDKTKNVIVYSLVKKKKNHSIQYIDSSHNLHLSKMMMYNHVSTEEGKQRMTKQTFLLQSTAGSHYSRGGSFLS